MLKNLFWKNERKFPIFLLGTKRSGTTLLQRILNSAEDVRIWGEHGGFLNQIAEAYFLNFEDKTIIRNIPASNAPFRPRAKARQLKDAKLWTGWHNYYSQEDLKDMFGSFVSSFFNPAFEKKDLFWGFKETRYGFADRTLEMLAELYPDAKFIFIIRNPIDIVARLKLSYLRKPTGLEHEINSSQLESFSAKNEFSAAEAAEQWTRQNYHFVEFSAKNSRRSLIIRYEELISQINVAEALTNWLNISYSQRKISNILNIRDGRGATLSDTKTQFPSLLNEYEIDQIKRVTQKVADRLDAVKV